MSGNPIVWFEIYVQDMERARAFYTGVLQCTLSKLDAPPGMDIEMLAFQSDMNGPGASGTLVRMTGVPSGGNSTLVYFHCDDCAVEASRVVAHGGSIHTPKTSLGPYGFMALVVDTEGNIIGLHSQK